LGRLSRDRSKKTALATNFNVGCAIYIDLDGALAAIPAIAARKSGSTLCRLSAQWRNQDGNRRQR
jgi:hypothetical protein